MASTPPPNVPSPNQPKGKSATPDFSAGIPSGPASAGGFASGIPTGPAATSGNSAAPGFTTHIPQLRNTFPTPADNADHSDYYASLNQRKGMSGQTKGILVAILVLSGFFGWRAWRGGNALAAWGSSWEKQVDQSEAQKRPQLVLFTADWCPACEDFESHVLTKKDVTAKLQEQFILTQIDLSDRAGPNNGIAATFGVKVIPTLVIVGPDGSRSDYLTGSVSEERLFDWIENRKMSKAK
jgi:thiol:disulfide interchange protein DsbD